MALVQVARDPERSRLIEEYLPIASRAAHRFARRGVEREDLVQVAALAVVRAVDRRDPRRSERRAAAPDPPPVLLPRSDPGGSGNRARYLSSTRVAASRRCTGAHAPPARARRAF